MGLLVCTPVSDLSLVGWQPITEQATTKCIVSSRHFINTECGQSLMTSVITESKACVIGDDNNHSGNCGKLRFIVLKCADEYLSYKILNKDASNLRYFDIALL